MRIDLPSVAPHLPSVAPQHYHRRWAIYLRGELIGEVLAATEQAACLRAIHRFGISREAQKELEVRPASAPEG
jgi:hypothetical protein